MMILTHSIGLPTPFLDKLQSSAAAFLACISEHEINDVSFGTHPWQIAHFPISFSGLGFQDFSVWAVTSFVIPFVGAIHHSLDGFSHGNTESLIHPPPALASGLSTWNLLSIHLLPLHLVCPPGQLQQTHELLLSIPLLLDYYLLTKSKGVTNPVLDLVNTYALQTLLLDLTWADNMHLSLPLHPLS